MFYRKLLVACVAIVLMSSSFCPAADTTTDEQTVSNNWNDFLHYARIGRLDLAGAFGQKLLDSSPDPEAVLDLSNNNPNGYMLLVKLNSSDTELTDISGAILDIIEDGRFIRRTDPKVITEEIRRLSSTMRAKLAAEKRLKNTGEYAIPFMLDALADVSRKSEFPNIISAMPKIGREAIRPLAASIQTENVAVRAEIVRALGEIGYFQPLPYLKYAVENDSSEEIKQLASRMIEKIDPSALKLSAAELFFQLGEQYYYHNDSLGTDDAYDFANVWLWNSDESKLVRHEVSKDYFNELMAMRCCEWALKADENIGKAIALWVASFFKAESYGVAQPEYFATGHADAITYARTAGAEYLHQSLERALKDGNAYVALWTIEALAANAGEKSLLYSLGIEQPLVNALSFKDTAVRYSAALAIGSALPNAEFIGSKLIVENLASAIKVENGTEALGEDSASTYAMRSVEVMKTLAVTGNTVVDLSEARTALIEATKGSWEEMQTAAGEVLARLESPDAQRAIAQMALNEMNSMDVRNSAFLSLAVSAKQNANLLEDGQLDAIYELVGSEDSDPDLRSNAASAYGALNLPSRKVKTLILDQAKR
ncbi:MAG: hypothetical protein KAS23_10595 [Anaerohalosphaera sp.]|nr:hypothetical protein [Anaerohalosphaera sp.]